MAKNFNQGRRAERQFKQKLRTMISSAAHKVTVLLNEKGEEVK